ncbi:hypothetical protein Scep_016425 [Stephania cephalantha]|uniref:Uncharacterized protein n=1 Tax=Stephania cephalantha TaxID=152367 RepID=A0AAP0IMT7_9MAGN
MKHKMTRPWKIRYGLMKKLGDREAGDEEADGEGNEGSDDKAQGGEEGADLDIAYEDEKVGEYQHDDDDDEDVDDHDKCADGGNEEGAANRVGDHEGQGAETRIGRSISSKIVAAQMRIEAKNMAHFENHLSQALRGFERQFSSNLNLNYTTFDSRVDKFEARMLAHGAELRK